MNLSQEAQDKIREVLEIRSEESRDTYTVDFDQWVEYESIDAFLRFHNLTIDQVINEAGITFEDKISNSIERYCFYLNNGHILKETHK